MNVFNPIFVIVPGRCPAISLNNKEMVPSGRLYPSTLFSNTSFCNAGINPQCPPIILFNKPSCPSLFRPSLSVPSPIPAENIMVRLLGCPLFKKDSSIPTENS